MNTTILTTILITSSLFILILLVSLLIYKKKASFTLIIEKGIITDRNGDIPSEFLYDIQQLARMNKPEKLVLKGYGITTNQPELKISGIIDKQLKSKMEHSLSLSL